MESELHVEMFGDRTGPVGLIVGFGPDAVVDVVCRDAKTRGVGERDQRRGVGAAGEGAGDGVVGGWERAATEQLSERRNVARRAAWCQSSCSRCRLPPGCRCDVTVLRYPPTSPTVAPIAAINIATPIHQCQICAASML